MDDLKHLQQVLLLIVKEIDALCRRHGITYYLSGGTAIGAERHGGFIPWDDDIDIMMPDADYFRFLQICREELPSDRWYVQEGLKDWPSGFSKLRLKGTYIEDAGEWSGIARENRGIFIDIFRITNASLSPIGRRLQYFCDKMLISNSLRLKGYATDSMLKKVMLFASNLLRIKPINNLCEWVVYRYKDKKTGKVARFGNNVRFRGCFFDADVFGTPVTRNFEGLELPVAAENHKFLTQTYGDYMQMPPECDRVFKHVLKVDFGSY